jgi:hypothetical protein
VHQAIVGRTNTGKSTLAKGFGAELIRAGHTVLVYNPLGNRDYIRPDARTGRVSASAEHASAAEFVQSVRSAVAKRDGRPVFLIVDEATTFFRKVNCPHEWMATRGRHVGLNLMIICQHYALLNTTVRGQCERLYLFACGLTTAALCADEFGRVELKDATRLKRGMYVRADLDGLTPGRVF